MIPETHLDVLRKKGFAHVATVGPRGEPQTNPVWYGWDGRVLRFSTTKGRQKYRNLVRDRRIAVSITDPDEPYRYLEIRGEATIEDDPEYAFIDSMAKKYTGRERFPRQAGEERVVVSVRPQRVTHMG